MANDLTDDERWLLVNMLTLEIEASKYPLSPRIEALKRIRAKLRGEIPPPAVADANTSRENRANDRAP